MSQGAWNKITSLKKMEQMDVQKKKECRLETSLIKKPSLKKPIFFIKQWSYLSNHGQKMIKSKYELREHRVS